MTIIFVHLKYSSVVCSMYRTQISSFSVVCCVLRVACHRHDHTNISNVLETEVGT